MKSLEFDRNGLAAPSQTRSYGDVASHPVGSHAPQAYGKPLGQSSSLATLFWTTLDLSRLHLVLLARSIHWLLGYAYCRRRRSCVRRSARLADDGLTNAAAGQRCGDVRKVSTQVCLCMQWHQAEIGARDLKFEAAEVCFADKQG